MQKGTWRNDSQKWLDSIEKQKKKKQFEVCDRQTDRDRERDRLTESIVDNNRLPG